MASSAFKLSFRQQHLVLSLGLGLFILLAGGGSLTTALLMTVALAFNLLLTTMIMFAIKPFLQQESKWIVTLLVMATIGTLGQLLAVAFMPGWVQGLAVYLPLIAISGLILARVETVVQTGTFLDVVMDGLGSILSFAWVIIPIGILADGLGLGVFQLATFQLGNPQPYWFSLTVLPPSLTVPIFTGPYGAMGMLILAALWIALLQRFRGRNV